MKKACTVYWTAALGGLTVAFLGLALVIHGWPGSDTGAAWVQAIGSLIALAIVYFAGKSQSDAALRAVKHSHELVVASRKQAALAGAAAAYSLMGDCLSEIESTDSQEDGVLARLTLIGKIEFQGFILWGQSLLSSLRSVDVVQLADPKVVRDYVEFVHAFDVAIQSATLCAANPWDDPAQKQIFESRPEGKGREKAVEIANKARVRNLKNALTYAQDRYCALHPLLSCNAMV